MKLFGKEFTTDARDRKPITIIRYRYTLPEDFSHETQTQRHHWPVRVFHGRFIAAGHVIRCPRSGRGGYVSEADEFRKPQLERFELWSTGTLPTKTLPIFGSPANRQQCAGALSLVCSPAATVATAHQRSRGANGASSTNPSTLQLHDHFTTKSPANRTWGNL